MPSAGKYMIWRICTSDKTCIPIEICNKCTPIFKNCFENFKTVMTKDCKHNKTCAECVELNNAFEVLKTILEKSIKKKQQLFDPSHKNN